MNENSICSNNIDIQIPINSYFLNDQITHVKNLLSTQFVKICMCKYVCVCVCVLFHDYVSLCVCVYLFVFVWSNNIIIKKQQHLRTNEYHLNCKPNQICWLKYLRLKCYSLTFCTGIWVYERHWEAIFQ